MIILTMIIIMVLGGYALSKLDKELNPSVGLDMAIVTLDAGDMNSLEVEKEVTTPLEQRIDGIKGVKKTDSTTSPGASTIIVTFERNRGGELTREIDTLANAFASGIPDITNTYVAQLGGESEYEFFLDISGGDMKEMSTFAKEIIKPRLEELPEVDQVELTGMIQPSIDINFKQKEMNKHGLHMTQVTELIQQMNTDITLGELKSEATSPSLRWQTPLTNIDDLKQLNIPTESGEIHLEKIADITRNETQDKTFVWKDGKKDFVFIQIGRASNVNQIDMANAVRKEIDAIRASGHNSDFSINELLAHGDFVKHAIDDVSMNILIGGAIAIAVLLLMLQNFRATFIIGLSIPTSILLTILSIWLLDYSLNMLTLIGLGLGIGMMVDASIVILESIFRKKKDGLPSVDAVLTGSKEVATAIIASMLTTIVVFVPIGLIGGDIGKYIIILSMTVAITLISSVIVAFTLIPTLAEKFMKVRKRKEKESKVGNWLLDIYEKTVGWIIEKKRRSLALIGVFVVLFGISIALVAKIPMNTMPEMFQRYTEIMIELDHIPSKEKEELAKKINKELQTIKDVDTNYLLDQGDFFIAIIKMTKGEDIHQEQEKVTDKIMQKLRALEKHEPILSVQSIMNGQSQYPVQLQINGEDFTKLKELSDQATEKLEEIEGIVGINTDMDQLSNVEYLSLEIDAIEEAGLNPTDVKYRLDIAFTEIPLDELTTEQNEKIPMLAMWKEKIDSKKSVLDLKIPTTDGEKKLASFITLDTEKVPETISHQNGKRYISVLADTEGKDLGAINREVQNTIKDIDTEAGYTISLGGDLEEQQDLMMDLSFVFILSILLVYFVMAVQFNHFGQPLIVMAIIPVTLIGVILGLFLTQMELNMMSGMGIIMLVGIVLNNAILLIDRANQLRIKGKSTTEALLGAGKDRIRPIFMTTFTTAGGMLPLALASGQSANYQAPLATVIISGLLFSTLITLILIPAVFRLFSRKPKGKRKKDSQQPA